jgi:hypothetical protein
MRCNCVDNRPSSARSLDVGRVFAHMIAELKQGQVKRLPDPRTQQRTRQVELGLGNVVQFHEYPLASCRNLRE